MRDGGQVAEDHQGVVERVAFGVAAGKWGCLIGVFGAEHMVVGQQVVKAQLLDTALPIRPTAAGSPRSSFCGYTTPICMRSLRFSRFWSIAESISPTTARALPSQTEIDSRRTYGFSSAATSSSGVSARAYAAASARWCFLVNFDDGCVHDRVFKTQSWRPSSYGTFISPKSTVVFIR